MIYELRIYDAMPGKLPARHDRFANHTIELFAKHGMENIAYWTEDGDALRVCDWSADGWGVRAYIYRPKSTDASSGEVLIKASDPKSDDNCAAASKNIPENIDIGLKVCKYRGDRVEYCDWNPWVR